MSQVTNTFNNIIVISRQFCRWREPEYMEKTNDLQTVTNTFNSIQVTMWQLALCSYILVVEQEYPDTKWAIRNRISKNRQHNGQKKKYKRWKSAECQEKNLLSTAGHKHYIQVILYRGGTRVQVENHRHVAGHKHFQQHYGYTATVV